MKQTLLTLALLAAGTLHAQEPWTLQRCIAHAVSQNLQVRQQQNQVVAAGVQLDNARHQRLPDLSASAGQNFSFGRGLTAENTYTNTNTSSTSFSLGASVPLFTGFQIPNNVKLQRLNLAAATADLARLQNDVRTQVAQAYVQVLYDTEQLAVARRQVAIDSMQVERLASLVAVGRAAEAELSQQRATLAQSQLTVAQADGQRQTSLLTLTQLLELPTAEGFAVATPELPGLRDTSEPQGGVVAPDENAIPAPPLPATVYAEAMGARPEVEADKLRLMAAERQIAIARAGYMPTLSLSGGLGSNYYKTSGFAAEGFGTQLKNNFSQYVGLSLQVPIFNRFQTRNSIRSAKLDRENQLLALDQTQKQLYKEIQQACTAAGTARARLVASRTATTAARDAFRLTEAKYVAGKATITEFNESKNQLLRAESELVQARYEWLYQSALIDFYRGHELTF